MRILGLDHGERRIGVALSDPTGTFAQPILVIERKAKLRADLRAIANLCRERGVEEVVIGMPLDMDGRRGAKAREVEAFAARLRDQLDVPVVEWDERLTTVAAERALREGNVRGRKRRKVVDKTAAALILQGYLDSKAIRPTAAPADMEERGGDDADVSGAGEE